MNRPSFPTRLLGHPLVTVPIMLTGMVALYACWCGGSDGIVPGLICAGIMVATCNACGEAGAYKQAKREWDALAENPAPRGGGFKAFASVVVAFALMCCWQGPTTVAYIAGYAVGAAMRYGPWVLALVAVALLVRWLRRRPRRAAQAMAVKVVAKTILPVPTLAAAYAALPEHCQRLLARPGS